MPRITEHEGENFFEARKKKRFIAHLVDDRRLQTGGRKTDSKYFRRRIASRKIAVVNYLIEQIQRLVIVASFVKPKLKPGLIDRFTVLAENAGVVPAIVFTKRDLVDRNDAEAVKAVYKATGYDCFVYSSLFPQGHNSQGMVSAGHLREMLFKGSTTAVVGHSGVGKTTMLLAVDRDYRARTAPISDFTNKGRHTTTRVKLYEFPFGGKVYDMPGLKEIDFIDIEKDQLQRCFPDIFAVAKHCKFKNCQHLDEHECAVKTAVERGELADQRFQSYLNIYASLA